MVNANWVYKWAFIGALLGVLLTASFCQAHASAPYARDAKLKRCMVYLPAVQDARLRRWCTKQQERMP